MRQEVGEQVAGATLAAPAAPVPEPRATRARLGYVDGLRAVAALYVVASHIGQEVWPRHAPGGLSGALVSALGYGHYAVSVFIVLSGFSLMLPVARHAGVLEGGAVRFYLRRVRRILPPYYFAVGFALLLIWVAIGQKTGTYWDISLPVTWTSVTQHVLIINDFAVAGGEKINFVFWSVAVECQIYVLFPALVWLWRRYPPLLSMMLVVTLSHILMVAALLTWIGRLSPYSGSQFIAPYTGLFAMGMFAASLYTAPSPRWTRLRAWRLWEILALTCFTVIALRSAAWPLYLLDLFVGAGTAGLLLAAAHPGRFNPARAALEWRPLVWVGGFSYSVYLIHAPLIQLLWQYVFHPLGLGDTLTYLALLLVGGPLIVAASWVFWYFCERPFLNSRPTATSPLARWPLWRWRLAPGAAR
jgi:peptidoglycan/LPS O-acetylase OafA/YrhL